ncbi:hypothetical protein TPHA_0L00910 [Tetrapisispora phaffii CBS 4417]|uniref:Uncharacterized protein n=1 Tax=Tetrapisispora phaffii (strain ATCC 24235 / CBS 4417 / NBRC 1672 / NRRL Y-8282 / UCD 70-5) TaxID=1071381 RepID=G8BZX0_TETPH|nr:hypothetical protein TPHA_0L00910 [Tetrapisispora phaffii CBS 4417]CCE65448.1 hypothetical protein TPHA_0L00910 [Tetrapisispora phaffii CBS 4417]
MSENFLVRDETSLRDLQINAIVKMLFLNNLNVNASNNGLGSGSSNTGGNLLDTIDLENSFNDSELSWKVLILDDVTMGIVSSILRVNDLLKCGVTIHYLIDQKRTPINDVPAIYFVTPTKANLDMITRDIKNDYYSDYYVNFSTNLERSLLEEFAKDVTLAGKSDKIKQVYDQYLNFIVTEPELFSLEINNTYSILNNPKSTEDVINTLCEDISNGLFNTIITSNTIPIIRAPVGGPAEIIAQKLSTKLRDYVINIKLSSNSSSSGSEDYLDRYVLVLLDRNIDFACMFSHSWIYQCMIFDVFNLSKNRVSIPINDTKQNEETENNNKTVQKMKTFDLDPNDFFWKQNSHLPFPEAAENVELELSKYKHDAEEITKKTGITDLNNLNSNSDSDTLQIQEAVKRLPELTARKSVIDNHMNIFSALLAELENKHLDSFFEIEQDPDNKNLKLKFMELLNDGKTNNLNDKLRTFVYLFLTSTNGLPNEFIKDVETYFEKNNFKIGAFKYIYKLREFMTLSQMSLQNKSLENGKPNNKDSQTSTTLSGLYNLTEGKLQGGVGSLITGIKKLLPEKKTIPITNIVEAIMDPLNSSQKNLETTDSYLYLDPRATRGSQTKKPKRQSYNKSIVFVVGGGNYLEYQNLQEWAHSELHNPKKVMYGSTAIVSPNDFLSEISTLSEN